MCLCLPNVILFVVVVVENRYVFVFKRFFFSFRCLVDSTNEKSHLTMNGKGVGKNKQTKTWSILFHHHHHHWDG